MEPKKTKSDLNSENIEFVVRAFYQKAIEDEVIGEKFSHLNIEDHIPKITQFWRSILMGIQGYKGSPFDKHIALKLEKEHFTRWIFLWQQTVDEYCEGAVAEDAKMRAQTIGDTFHYKIEWLKTQH